MTVQYDCGTNINNNIDNGHQPGVHLPPSDLSPLAKFSQLNIKVSCGTHHVLKCCP